MDSSDLVIATSRQLARRGVDSSALSRLTARGELIRVSPGAYAERTAWGELGDRDRFVAVARGIVATRPGELLISHRSAAVLHGLPVVGGLPRRLDSLRSDVGGGRSETSIAAHRSAVLCEPVELGDFCLTSLERTLADVALAHPLVVSVAMLDHALFHGTTTLEAVEAELEPRRRHPGSKRALAALGVATAGSESPLESLVQVRCFEGGWERPEQQAPLPLLGGRRAFVDCLWRGRTRRAGPGLIVEADGRYKYGPTAQLMTGDEHWKDKVREDDLREQGFDFRRPTWDRAWSRSQFEAMMRGTGVRRTL
ncbi:type IV toxin-antitoxin system AbiEi family antitoxin domain-containing protein [Frigoribacterium sp. PvP032]|uniref:type IV toxin-antitoxin system AbiEi family antitoxin domain-containing protein n=1 Tax=Frigoribacterium sp. PvP032 TaxID=2806589 RepID=UPI001AE28044|nr:type IV toxin-antitoxin system AbiEi family antitoxin domain-containing protein [Frigoribacterium sp. PvP032]MBP1191539.1 hypothetical protein [Frigoribacterium sp. PvP032]